MQYVEEGTEFEARIVTDPDVTAATVKVVDPDTDAVLVEPVTATEDSGTPGRWTALVVAPDAAIDGHGFLLVWTLTADPAVPAVSNDLMVTVGAPSVNIAGLPDVSDVGAFLRARTRTKYGTEAGTFTLDTRPTRGQVLALIGLAQSHVAGILGFGTLSDGLARMSRTAVALRAAMLVELSYFPEQVQSGRSPYEHLRDLYESEVERLKVAASDDDLDDGIGATADARLPRYSVPHHRMTTFDMEF